MPPTKQSTINPSDVCNRIIRQHRAVDTQLDEMERGAKTLPTGGPAALQRVLELTRALCDDLLTHIVSETKLLVPALRGADAWGNLRANKLLDQLRTRKRELRLLRKSCLSAQNEVLPGTIDRFVEGRRSDMALTERESLNPRVLRDDVVGIDSSGG